MADVISIHRGEEILNFESVNSAFSEAVSGDMLVLLDDCTCSPNIQLSNISLILDLAGKVLSCGSGNCIFNLVVGSSLLVKDSSEEQTGELRHTSSMVVTLSNISDMSKRPVFTLESGTLQAQEFGVCTFGGSVINIKGGTVIAKDNGAIGSNGSNTSARPYGQYPYEINISGGDIIANTESAGYANCAIYHANAGKLNISGGNIVATAGAGVVVRAGDVNITGGTISGQGTSSGEKMGDATPTYCGGVEICNAANYPGQMGGCVISGGTITSVANYGVSVIGDPEDYPNALNSKCVISGGTVAGELGAVGYMSKEGDPIEDEKSSKLVIVGGDFNSDVDGFIDPSVNLFKEYDEDGNVHYVIKGGLEAVISYLDEILDSGNANDAEIISNIKDMLSSLGELSDKADVSNQSLDDMKSTLASTQATLEDTKDKLDEIKDIASSSQESSADSDSKLASLVSMNERLIALQQKAVEELIKIAGDGSVVPGGDDIVPTDEPAIMSIKALIKNAKRTGQDTAIWQHPMTPEVKSYLDENGITYSLVKTAKLGDQWLITIPEGA